MTLLTEQLRNGQIDPVSAIEQAADLCRNHPSEAFLRVLPIRWNAALEAEKEKLEAEKDEQIAIAAERSVDQKEEAYNNGWNDCLDTVDANLPSHK